MILAPSTRAEVAGVDSGAGGAGSATGDAGGIVLVYLPETPPSEIEAELNIKLEPVLMA